VLDSVGTSTPVLKKYTGYQVHRACCTGPIRKQGQQTTTKKLNDNDNNQTAIYNTRDRLHNSHGQGLWKMQYWLLITNPVLKQTGSQRQYTA
jgi:hypothetical protein